MLQDHINLWALQTFQIYKCLEWKGGSQWHDQTLNLEHAHILHITYLLVRDRLQAIAAFKNIGFQTMLFIFLGMCSYIFRILKILVNDQVSN